jgi:hypothetical protein
MDSRFEVHHSPESDFRIGEYAGEKYGPTHNSLKQALAAAEQAVRDGLHGVNVWETSGAYAHIVPYCGHITQGYYMHGDRWWPTYWCVRHDLHRDGKCTSHTQGGGLLPAPPEQLALTIGGAQ